MNKLEDMFDDDKLNKAVKKGKKRNILKITGIAVIVFILGTILNTTISRIISIMHKKRMDIAIGVNIPNAYIGKCVDIFSFLGGTSHYTVYKEVGWRAVPLYSSVSSIGLNTMISSGRGGEYYRDKGWDVQHWENGYKKLMFFHPDIKYKEYKKDFEYLNSIPDGKIIEIGLSFDKKYNLRNFSTLIPKFNISWLRLDTYTKEQIDKYRKDAKEHDSKVSYIGEEETLGIRTEGNVVLDNIYKANYSGLLNRLKKLRYKDIYNHLKERKTDPEIIGVIVYGTKSELKTLMNNPHIKGATIGVMRDKD
ncbi:anti sigma factor C-terminal domain-containing protein (plasmid) [Clostridium botulinum]|uniref:anti sigma factor C-terminal domain-containing protein n=1 Tax=Clostridium botulinum TaxID=1491 RepID=UPI000A98CC70|nr:anti sigma factor C-terminal domain-containing protein [Clostridium botulinum]MCD3235305.1 hypothetical protein [Clostridium botulinum D/C]MCD3268703.1 hypothetical protein [Clostridium botulinum D/C]MCD3300836.1 hypothetical protein [Clostridium botulinum D/C]MCD3307008.1 hypothetical protein [Clostridium botulinum D/C]MCD3315711.1 hypothetical protein [Clostridium botulinum D/C]